MKSRATKYLLGCWLLLFTSTLSSQNAWPDTLPPDAEISLLTASPGNQVHNIFGHSALRLYSKSAEIDYVFNWGTFNYKTDNFVPKFILGSLPYYLSVANYRYFEGSYTRQGRSLTEVVLDLSQSEKQKLNDLLIENYQKENRIYQYDFFYDNCSTRIRDLVETSIGAELQGPQKKFTTSFKHILQKYLDKDDWLRLGINLILGRKANENVNFRSAMFLPEYLESNFKQANNNGKPLVKTTTTIYSGKDQRKATLIPPFIPFGMLLLLGIFAFFKQSKPRKNLHLVDKILFSLVGLAGWLFLFMWLGTKHIATLNQCDIFARYFRFDSLYLSTYLILSKRFKNHLIAKLPILVCSLVYRIGGCLRIFSFESSNCT